MHHAFFHALEPLSDGESIPLPALLAQLSFNEQGLLPVIAQEASTKAVLMLAWVNRAALEQTLRTGEMTYWSRSSQALWVKGGTSGHRQRVVSMRFDCDGDTLLCTVEQRGAACHTQRPHCFYLRAEQSEGLVYVDSGVAAPMR